jgi:hypothetical protein
MTRILRLTSEAPHVLRFTVPAEPKIKSRPYNNVARKQSASAIQGLFP